MTKSDFYNFPKWLKAEMDSRSIGTKKLSEDSGVTEQSISGYRSGRRSPEFITQVALMNALGYDIEIKRVVQ